MREVSVEVNYLHAAVISHINILCGSQFHIRFLQNIMRKNALTSYESGTLIEVLFTSISFYIVQCVLYTACGNCGWKRRP